MPSLSQPTPEEAKGSHPAEGPSTPPVPLILRPSSPPSNPPLTFTPSATVCPGCPANPTVPQPLQPLPFLALGLKQLPCNYEPQHLTTASGMPFASQSLLRPVLSPWAPVRKIKLSPPLLTAAHPWLVSVQTIFTTALALSPHRVIKLSPWTHTLINSTWFIPNIT